MTTITIADFIKSNNFTSVAKQVRANINGYTYVTFIDSKNEATNIYLSKSLALEVFEGTSIGKGFFANKTIAETANGEGEVRYKLAHKDSQRISLEDIM